MGLNELQRKVDELVKTELIKLNVGQASGLGSTSGGVVGSKPVGFKGPGSSLRLRPVVTQTPLGRKDKAIAVGPNPSVGPKLLGSVMLGPSLNGKGPLTGFKPTTKLLGLVTLGPNLSSKGPSILGLDPRSSRGLATSVLVQKVPKLTELTQTVPTSGTKSLVAPTSVLTLMFETQPGCRDGSLSQLCIPSLSGESQSQITHWVIWAIRYL